MDDKQIIYAKRTLYYLLLQKEANRITSGEAELIFSLARDPDIQSVFSQGNRQLEDIYAPNR